MAFEVMEKKNYGKKLKSNQISVCSNIIIFGSDLEEEFQKGDRLRILIDYDNKKIAFEKMKYTSEDSYKVQKSSGRQNASPHITAKSLCKRIANKRYKIDKIGDLWVFTVTDIVDNRRVAI